MSPRPLVNNGADVQQVRRAERKVQQGDDLLAARLREVLDTPAGRFVCWALLEQTHVFRTSFDHSGSVMYFTEGERNVGLAWRAKMLAADEALYELMEREARHRDKRLDGELAATQQSTAEASDGSEG
jgi:hypothetical protein